MRPAPVVPFEPRRSDSQYDHHSYQEGPHTVYKYTRADGDLAYEVVRIPKANGGKTFRHRHYSPSGGVIHNLDGIRQLPFGLPEIHAYPDQVVHVTEGEKDTITLRRCGFLATSIHDGALSPPNVESFRGRHIVVHQDNDKTGVSKALARAIAFQEVAASVRIMTYPDLPQGDDVSDFLAIYSSDELQKRVTALRPWTLGEECAPHPTAAGHLIVRSFDAIEAREPEWVWKGWVPKGTITILGGHAGDGKSTAVNSIAAKLTRGQSLPDGTHPCGPMNVMFLSAEESAEFTVKPRFVLHDGDQSRAFFVDGVADVNLDGTRWFNLERDAAFLHQAIDERKIDLVIVDPLSSYLTGVNRNDEGAIRDAIQPLVHVANQTGVAIVGVMHTGKSGDLQRRPDQMLLGSSGFVAASRSTIMLVPLAQPDQPKESPAQFVMEVVKSNLAMRPRPILLSRGQDEPITWHGESAFTVEQCFARRRLQSEVGRQATAEEFLQHALQDGPRAATKVKEEAATQGFKEITLRRASKSIGMISERRGFGPTSQFFWRLPEASKPT